MSKRTFVLLFALVALLAACVPVGIDRAVHNTLDSSINTQTNQRPVDNQPEPTLAPCTPSDITCICVPDSSIACYRVP